MKGTHTMNADQILQDLEAGMSVHGAELRKTEPAQHRRLTRLAAALRQRSAVDPADLYALLTWKLRLQRDVFTALIAKLEPYTKTNPGLCAADRALRKAVALIDRARAPSPEDGVELAEQLRAAIAEAGAALAHHPLPVAHS